MTEGAANEKFCENQVTTVKECGIHKNDLNALEIRLIHEINNINNK